MKFSSLSLLLALIILQMPCLLPAFPVDRVIVGVDENYPPYEYVDADGNITGFNVELLRKIGEKNNTKFVFIAGPWSEIRKKFEAQELNMLSGMFYSVDREKLYSFSIPHSYVYFNIFYRKDHPYKNKNSILGKNILVQKEDYMHEYLMKLGKKVKLNPVKDPEEAIILLSNDNKYDYAALAKITAYYFIKKKGIKNITHDNEQLSSKKYCYAFHKNDLKLVSKINEGIFIVTNSGEYTSLYNKWFRHLENEKVDYRVFWAFVIPSLVLVFLFFFFNLRLSKKFRYKSLMLTDSQKKETAFKKALEKNEKMLKSLMELMKEGVWEWDLQSKELNFNLGIYDQLGYEPFEFSQSQKGFLSIIHPDDKTAFERFIFKFIRSSKDSFEYEMRVCSKDKEFHWLQIKGMVAEKDKNGVKKKLLGIYSEITEKKKLTDHQQQSQKMEALGRLAGGISHDFNNLLTAILGNLDIALVNIEAESALHTRLKTIRDTAIKASELTKQLLFLSRKKENNPIPLNINDSIKKMNAILYRLLGEDINLSLHLNEDLPLIKADSSQIDQILLNLAINARESMPKGGKITIESRLIHLDENYTQFDNDFKRGNFILVSFTDSGCGINSETLKHLFEPFYSTKENGTGLGLSIVYNAMQDVNGFVNVYSEVNYGTSFKLYFPIINETETEHEKNHESQLSVSTSQEMLYLVEDNPEIRVLIKDIAQIGKYQIEVFANSTEFFEHLSLTKDLKFDLLICDIILPEIKGYELVNQLIDSYSHSFKVLYISGYPDEVIIRDHPISSANFLSKPFSATALLNKIRYVLDHKINI